jgi:small-conductance mechanosensitive channel
MKRSNIQLFSRAALFGLLLLAALTLCARCLGASPVASPLPQLATPPASEPMDDPALVEVFNRRIIVLHATAFGTSPTERVKRINARVASLLERKIYGPVASRQSSEGALITVGDEFTFMIHPGDVDPVAGKSFDLAVEESVHQLAAALNEARLQHSAPFILKAAGKVAGATLVFTLAITVLLHLRRRFLPRILNLERQLASRISAQGFVSLARLVGVLRWTLHVVSWLVFLAITFEWASICLGLFPYTRPWADRLQENLLGVLRRILPELVGTLPRLLVIVVIIALARGVIAILHGFFSGIESGRVQRDWMDVEAARATRRILTIIVWLFAIVMIYPYIPGSESGAFKGMSVFVGVLLSIGSASVVGQFTSGLVLMYSRALKPGEYVRIDEHEGTVESLGFLSTKIRSPKNEELHVPNTVILGTTVKNYSRLAREGGLLVHTSVTIGYATPWRQVHALLIAAANSTPGIGPEPAPFVLQTALSDFYVEYQLNACLANPQERAKILAALHASIQDQFNTHGVQIMSPHYEADKAQPVVVPRERWHAPPASPDSRGNQPGSVD